MRTMLASTPKSTNQIIGAELQFRVEQFYYQEARLLDSRQFYTWFELLDESIHYYMPLRLNRIMRDSKQEFSAFGEFAHFDDNYDTLRGRLRKATSDLSWAENPPSRTRHLISNIIIEPNDEAETLDVSSAFIVYRNKMDTQVDIFAGERRDTLCYDSNPYGFKVMKRTILVDQSTILSANLALFF